MVLRGYAFCLVILLFGNASFAFDPRILYMQGLEPINEVFEPAGTYDPKLYGKVAVVQWAPSQATPLGVTAVEAEAFKMANRKSLEAYIRVAVEKGAKMVITPEFAVVGYPDIADLPPEADNFRNRADVAPYVETIPGPSTEYFAKIAKELGVYIHVGFAEVDSKTQKYHNAVAALDPSGKLIARYRKIHLYQNEGNFLEAGKDPVIYNSIFGKIGFAICSDIYSNHPMNYYRDAAVNAIALSTSWAQWNTGMNAFKRGARWTNAYVLAANQDYFPDSGVVNPNGTTQSHIRQSSGVAYGYLPLKNVKSPSQEI